MNGSRSNLQQTIKWKETNGTPVSCEEKLKVLNENLDEIRQYCQDAFEDALLMDCDEEQIRSTFSSVISSMKNPHSKK